MRCKIGLSKRTHRLRNVEGVPSGQTLSSKEASISEDASPFSASAPRSDSTAHFLMPCYCSVNAVKWILDMPGRRIGQTTPDYGSHDCETRLRIRVYKLAGGVEKKSSSTHTIHHNPTFPTRPQSIAPPCLQDPNPRCSTIHIPS